MAEASQIGVVFAVHALYLEAGVASAGDVVFWMVAFKVLLYG